MIRKMGRLNFNNKLYWQKFAKVFLKKMLIALSILLILIFLKKINYNKTNDLLEIVQKNIEYEFNLITDGKKVYTRTVNFIDNSLDSIGVFKEDSIKLNAPIPGTVYKKYGDEIKVNNEIVKNSGLDIRSISEVDPKAIIDGTVSNIEFKGNKGYFVTLNKDNLEITYGYLSRVYVSEGGTVKEGDIIGLLGTNKDGNKYLRIELQIDKTPVNPMDYIDITS